MKMKNLKILIELFEIQSGFANCVAPLH